MRYMMFINHSEDLRSQEIPAGLLQAMGEFVAENMKSGVLIDTAGLQATRNATRIRLAGGKLKKTDGPFTEAKEVVGGYALIEAKSNQEAVDMATQFMELHRIHWPEFVGTCEVRPLEVEGQ